MRAVSFLTRTELRRAWRSLVVIGVVAGLASGAALALVAGARRTATAPARAATAADAPDVNLRLFSLEGFDADARAALAELDDLPGVERTSESLLVVGRTDETLDWFYPTLPQSTADSLVQGDALRAGRLPDPEDPSEVVVSVSTAEAQPLGSTIGFRPYLAAQVPLLGDDSNLEPEGAHHELEVVGVVVDANDTSTLARIVYGTPALAEQVEEGDSAPFPGLGLSYWLEEDGDARAEVIAAIDALRQDPRLAAVDIEQLFLEDTVGDAEGGNRVLVIGLCVLAGLVLLAGLASAGALYSRAMARRSLDLPVCRSLGLSRRDQAVALSGPGLLTIATTLVIAAPVAVLLSDRFPAGRLDVLEPSLGHEVNVPVLGVGLVVVAALLGGTFLLLARRTAHAVGTARTQKEAVAHPAFVSLAGRRVVPWIVASLAFGRSRRRITGTIPIRSAVVGVALAVAGVVGVLTFSTTTAANVDDHQAYGVPWDLGIEVPRFRIIGAVDRLSADPEISAVATYSGNDVLVDGAPAFGHLLDPAEGDMGFPRIEGRTPFGRDEVAVGPSFLQDRDLEIGDTITVEGPALTPDAEPVVHDFRIVGTTLHYSANQDEHGSDVVFSPEGYDLILPDDFPELVVVAYAPGTDSAAKDAELDELLPAGVQDESLPRRPARVETLAQIGALPPVLGWTLAVLGLALMANALVVTTRQRAHDLAVLRGLGCSPNQERLSVLGMATVQSVLGLVVGLPLGIVLARLVWQGVAERVDLSPAVQLPWPAMATVVVAVLVIANLAALWPALRLSTKGPAEQLRSE